MPIRPQSLIGEKFVECTPTQPRPSGEPRPPPLREIPDGEPGEGQHLLPVEHTSKPVDIDLRQQHLRLPYRQRLSIILNELGAGVAGRGEDLNETIRRANPALGATNEVLEILGEQNQVLRELARDSDTVLARCARPRERRELHREGGHVAQATAERRADLERNFERLPRFLDELRPTMVRLGALRRRGRAGAEDLGRRRRTSTASSASSARSARRASPPSSRSARPRTSAGPRCVRTQPIIEELARPAEEAKPLADQPQAS